VNHSAACVPRRGGRARIVAKTRALKPQLESRYNIQSLALFGSYARRKQTPGSDLDLLVSFRQVPSLLRFVEMEDFLSDSLSVKVGRLEDGQ
jgi:predicted nucleotidyltransferase